jgi:hypothetical protein
MLFYVATLSACVIVEAANITEAQRKGTTKLAKALNRIPKIHTCRLATADEIDLHFEDLIDAGK